MAGRDRRLARRGRFSPGRGVLYLVLCLGAAACVFPFLWLIRSALMSTQEIFMLPVRWIPKRARWENYVEAFSFLPFHRFFLNTLLLVVVNAVAHVLSASFAAFGFSRLRFRGRDLWFGVVISTMMIPYAVMLIPQFIGFKTLGMYNTYWPLVLPAFFAPAFYVFLMRQFNMTIPIEYDQAALVDGANYLQIYAHIMLPLARSALVTVGVFTFMGVWADFFQPLIYIVDQMKYTLSLGLLAFKGTYNSDWNLIMAASSILIIPSILIFFFAQRYFMEGIQLGGLKG